MYYYDAIRREPFFVYYSTDLNLKDRLKKFLSSNDIELSKKDLQEIDNETITSEQLSNSVMKKIVTKLKKENHWGLKSNFTDSLYFSYDFEIEKFYIGSGNYNRKYIEDDIIHINNFFSKFWDIENDWDRDDNKRVYKNTVEYYKEKVSYYQKTVDKLL